MRLKLLPLLLLFILFRGITYSQELRLFNYSYIEDNNIGFISLSDIYTLSEHPDSSSVPDIKKLGVDQSLSIVLDKEYRQRFFNGTGISESDNVYIYNYAENKLKTFKAKDLQVIALLNFYASVEDWPFSQYDYMIGFQIDNSQFADFNENYFDVLVYIGKENPFISGLLKPITWERAATKDKALLATIPTDDSFFTDREITDYSVGDIYTYESEGYSYYIKNLFDSNNELFVRHLIVVNTETKKLVCERIYDQWEGNGLASLNIQGEENEYADYQWTGQLFKGMDPVIFGFQYFSFGCPYITILNPNDEEVYIYCDNRH